MPRTDAITRPRILLPLLLITAPILATYLILYRFAVPIPLLDDYNAVLQFLLQQRSLPGIATRLLAIIRFQHGEYKLIFEHLLFSIWYGATGAFSFRIFLTLGNLLLLPALLALWQSSFRDERSLRRRLWLFLPVTLLLFELCYVELLDWVMASLSALAVVPFALCSLTLLARRSRAAFTAACLFAVLACGSSSSGFLLAPAGLLVLHPLRRRRRLLTWCVPFALSLAAYLDHYQPIPHARAPLTTIAAFFLSFLGGAVENMHGFPLRHAALILGALLLVVVAHSVHTRLWQREPVLFATGVWVLLTAALVAGVRSELGAVQSLASRYKIYSVLLLIYCYLYLADRARHAAANTLLAHHARRAYLTALALALLFNLSTDIVGWRFLSRRHDHLVQGLAHYQADPAHVSPLYAPDDPQDFSEAERTFERLTLNQAISTGLYQPPG